MVLNMSPKFRVTTGALNPRYWFVSELGIVSMWVNALLIAPEWAPVRFHGITLPNDFTEADLHLSRLLGSWCLQRTLIAWFPLAFMTTHEQAVHGVLSPFSKWRSLNVLSLSQTYSNQRGHLALRITHCLHLIILFLNPDLGINLMSFLL